MKITVETVGDYMEFRNLFASKIKEMKPEQIKEIILDKTHKYHKSMNSYIFATGISKALTKHELEEIKDENFRAFVDRAVDEGTTIDRIWEKLKDDSDMILFLDTKDIDSKANEIWASSLSKNDLENLMFKSCEKGDLETLKICINAGVDLNICNQSNSTPLAIAAERGKFEIVKLLIEKRANVNHRSHYGDTPLHAAVVSGDIDIVEELIHAGADQSIANMDGLTPLQCANSWETYDDMYGKRLKEIAEYLERKLGKTTSKKSRNELSEDVLM